MQKLVSSEARRLEMNDQRLDVTVQGDEGSTRLDRVGWR
jgi:hypothetical protein